MLKSLIIESVDRLGKNTLVDGLRKKLGYFDVIHYQKPILLELFVNEASQKLNLDVSDPSVISLALKKYQEKSFLNMFKMLSYPEIRYIMNRGHCGEAVYSHRYRNYSGDYVFDLEQSLRTDDKDCFSNSTLLVLLKTSSFEFIKDDGLSFDFSKKEEEQIDFINAFKRSSIKNKLIIDVHDGEGNFVPAEEILNAVIYAYTELDNIAIKKTLRITWRVHQDVLQRYEMLIGDKR